MYGIVRKSEPTTAESCVVLYHFLVSASEQKQSKIHLYYFSAAFAARCNELDGAFTNFQRHMSNPKFKIVGVFGLKPPRSSACQRLAVYYFYKKEASPVDIHF